MNKHVIATFAAALMLFGASSSFALPVKGATVTISEGLHGSTSGGEFRIVDPSVSGKEWIGFCLELNETLNYNTPYTVKSVANFAEQGGVGGAVDHDNDEDTPTRDGLSKRSKWLYYNYMFGDYEWSRDKSSGDESANIVQNLLWYFEAEKDLDRSSDTWQFFRNVFRDQYRADPSISGTVKVLNIMDGETFKQSLIVGEQQPVPEPATLLLMGSGLMGIVGLARRRKK